MKFETADVHFARQLSEAIKNKKYKKINFFY